MGLIRYHWPVLRPYDATITYRILRALLALLREYGVRYSD